MGFAMGMKCDRTRYLQDTVRMGAPIEPLDMENDACSYFKNVLTEKKFKMIQSD